MDVKYVYVQDVYVNNNYVLQYQNISLSANKASGL